MIIADAEAARVAADRPLRRARGRWSLVLTLLVVALVALRLFVFEPVTVVSGSMRPTLHAGDHVLTESISLRAGSLDRGDLVTFERTESGELMLKRVSGLPGDTVAIRDGRLVVNGDRVDEPYLDLATVDSSYFGPVVVPAGSVFVLGDNRAWSLDSRDFGPVAESDLVGSVVLHW